LCDGRTYHGHWVGDGSGGVEEYEKSVVERE
jgi:hypothetical protein